MKEKESYVIPHTIDNIPGGLPCEEPSDPTHKQCSSCRACYTCMGKVREVLNKLHKD